ncbi:neuropilin-1-like [Haliotis asinina]|uniref:neuropilin-1-like n=1 Tax=Haliotis asinina TaxID=109174 RepID=UPI00353218AD
MTIKRHLGVYLCLAITGVSLGSDLDCDFETDFCQWTNGSSVRQWQRQLFGTITAGTGPNTGHTISGRDDYYIYLHAGERRNENGFVESGNCVLLSPDFNTTSGGGCFRFWYHMKGSGIGNLSAAVLGGSSNVVIWSKTGEQGPDWKCAHVSLEQERESLKIEMTAWTGLSILGDIALDDFKFFDNQCSGINDVCGNVSTSPVPISPPTAQSPTQDKPSSTSTTATDVSTTPTQDDVTMTIVYISIAPVILLLVATIVAVIFYRRSKTPHRENNNSSNNQTNPHVDDYDYLREEVYDVLDESKMYNDGHVFLNSANDDRRLNDHQLTSDIQGHQGGTTVMYRATGSSGRAEIGNDITGSNVTMKTRDVNAVSEGENYMVSVPGPDEIGGSGVTATEDVANVSGKEGGALEASHGDATGRGLILPPPPCGSTSSYISPVFEND